jgi:DNA-binding response OmpR family regulator
MPSAKPSILYIDDDEGARLILTLHFGQEGYEVLAVSSSQATQFIVPEETFDLYILGSQLSKMNSTAFCRKIRQFERYAPIIIYSEDISEQEHDAMLCAQCTVLIANSGIDELLDKVRAELEF